MNKHKNLQIFITRPFFVVASQCLYQRVQEEKAHPMALVSDVWAPFLHSGTPNRNIIFYQATASPSILPSNVIALHCAHNHLGQEAQ